MQRARYRDTPSYADDLIVAAGPIRSQFIIGAGFLIGILIAISAVEAPIRHQDFHVGNEKEGRDTVQILSRSRCISSTNLTN
jgi:hypothetical protein